jgi:hypothetical protein
MMREKLEKHNTFFLEKVHIRGDDLRKENVINSIDRKVVDGSRLCVLPPVFSPRE